MRALMSAAGMLCMVMTAGIAGNINPPGAPSAGSGLYTLQGLYDYLMNGTALTVAPGFQGPASAPGPTQKSANEIGDAIKEQFSRCDAAVADVRAGKKFFCTVPGSWGVQTGTGVFERGRLLKTGQMGSSQVGDDGYYQKGLAFSYTNNGDGTVTDNVTGLMWASDGIGAGCFNGRTIYWQSALSWAEGLTFAGYSDWRLPNINELLSIMNISSGVDYNYFPNTVMGMASGSADLNNYYWVSTPARIDADGAVSAAFMVAFGSRETVGGNTESRTGLGERVRAVRGGE